MSARAASRALSKENGNVPQPPLGLSPSRGIASTSPVSARFMRRCLATAEAAATRRATTIGMRSNRPVRTDTGRS